MDNSADRRPARRAPALALSLCLLCSGRNAAAARPAPYDPLAIPAGFRPATPDVAPVGDADLTSRLAVFPALPPGGKYELVLDGAEHSSFTDRALPGDAAPRNPNHRRVILALSTAFWDAWLHDDAAARKWLDGGGPSSLVEPGDRWRRK